jgi:alpha-galactosidase
VPTYTALADITKWWETFPGNEPAAVPEVARCPMYSTWYSFHQATIPSEILAELRLAKEMGCSAVIVDDGWQTDDMLRGYASCGVWQVAASKIPDMRQFVADVHALGMKFLLWYSVPFIGTETEAWKTFGTMVLEENPENTACLDPRFKEVREYLIGIYERALIDWDLDGFKLDFVDSYSNFYESLRPDPRHDIPDLSVAVDRLLKDVLARLRAIKPDIMIEFRQNYVGPLMRTYGNMFRASDCPNDALTNRRRIADVRLLSGNTATHSDMMMWHKDEPVEVAALQYNNIFFSVPQISVMIRSIPEDHRKMLKYYTQFWNENRDVLLDGEFRPYNPELSYPVITGVTADKQLSCAYALNAVSIDPNPNTVILVNATGFPYMIVDAPKSQWDVTVTDCMGNVISTDTITLDGIAKLDIPLSGIMTAKKK